MDVMMTPGGRPCAIRFTKLFRWGTDWDITKISAFLWINMNSPGSRESSLIQPSGILFHAHKSSSGEVLGSGSLKCTVQQAIIVVRAH